jgi:hypothetical protein
VQVQLGILDPGWTANLVALSESRFLVTTSYNKNVMILPVKKGSTEVTGSTLEQVLLEVWATFCVPRGTSMVSEGT